MNPLVARSLACSARADAGGMLWAGGSACPTGGAGLQPARLFLATLLLLPILCASCARREPLQDLGSVPRFHLTDQTGNTFDSASLAGRVWVADFIYTTCPGPCPLMSARMRRIQTATKGIAAVRLVSFTVDPEHDTPTVLAEYAKRFAADESRWTFLTGEPRKLNELGVNVFHLNSVDGNLVHSTRFALVDREGRIRKYYASDEEGFLDKIVRDVKELEAARP